MVNIRYGSVCFHLTFPKLCSQALQLVAAVINFSRHFLAVLDKTDFYFSQMGCNSAHAPNCHYSLSFCVLGTFNFIH